MAFEASNDLDDAIKYYEVVCKADSSFVSAAFRLAGCQEKKGDRAAAAAALRRVPSSSSRFGHAQLALARLLSTPPPRRAFPPIEDLLAASEALQALDGLMDGVEVTQLKADLFHVAALYAAGGGGAGANAAADAKVLGVAVHERALRFAAEEAFRTCARQAATELERYAFVDRANSVRPVTWV
jgi:serine/threonine-protein kinase PknG